MRVGVIGWLCLHGADGAEIELGGALERRVLAALVLQAGRVASLDTLAEAVFGAEVPANATMRLHDHVSRLRRRVGAGTVVTVPGGYRLNVDDCELDWLRFEQLVAAALALPAAESSRAGDLFGEALALWRGTPFAELEDWPPARMVAGELEELRRVALEERAGSLVASGHSREAVGALEGLVADEPLRERRWALLMLALYRCGRQAEALRAFQRARAALGELGLVPGRELCSLERDVSVHAASLTIDDSTNAAGSETMTPELDFTARRPNNLPVAVTRFVGRATELQRRVAELATHRLVTLTGTGGVGKTRLATEIAWSMANKFADGVWLMELAPVADPAAVGAAVASTMSIPAQQGMTMVQSIVDWLRGRHLLLVVDNCEHVLGPVAELVRAVEAGSPTVTVLATSREPLGVPGELVRPVAPLDPASEAVELFCECAVAADESFTPSEEDRAAITAICRRLEGLPLAIELAAARIRALTPSDLLAHLDDRFRLLGATGRVERHQSLQDVVAWSYDLISDREQLLFDRLSVFAGGFDLAAAEAVCTDQAIHEDDVVGILSVLVDKSMVIVDRRQHSVRYRLLETLRQYGQLRLRERGETAAMRQRHLDYYADVARRASQLWASPRQLEADTLFDREWDNLRAAHAWTVTTFNLDSADALVATTALHAFARLSQEHSDWAERTLALDVVDRHPDATTYGWAAYWAYIVGDHDHAIELARRGIGASPAPEHPDTSWCWYVLVMIDFASGRLTQTQKDVRSASVAVASNPDLFVQWSVLSEVVDVAFDTDLAAVAGLVTRLASLADQIGAPSLRARTAFYEGRQKIWADDPSDAEAALACYRKGLELAHDVGDITNVNVNLVGIVFADTTLQVPGAGRSCKEAIDHFYASRHWSAFWLALPAITSWWKATGNLDAVAVICGHVDAHHPPWSDADAYRRGPQTMCHPPGADQLMARGAAMDRDKLVAFVLDQLTRHNDHAT